MPNYIVVPTLHGDIDAYREELLRLGYLPAHVSPGRVYFKQGIWITETFVIYRRLVR